jgi:hypothetical protein
MARPFKTGVDYFPLDVSMDEDVELLEAEHNIVGFGVLIKLYQKIYANNFWINWDNKSALVFSNRINVNINSINAIINSCLEWGIFDKKLLENYQILTSRGIQKRFFEITKRRSEIEIVKQYLLIELPENKKQRRVFVNINLINANKSTQSKVKESKVKESKASEDTLQLFEKAFEKWWLKSPKRNGRRIGKKDAKKQFLKIKQTEWSDLNIATENYLKYLSETGLNAMDAKRFLNEKWKDYIDVIQTDESKEDNNCDIGDLLE